MNILPLLLLLTCVYCATWQYSNHQLEQTLGPFDLMRVLIKGSFIPFLYKYGRDWQIVIQIDGVIQPLPDYFKDPQRTNPNNYHTLLQFNIFNNLKASLKVHVQLFSNNFEYGKQIFSSVMSPNRAVVLDS